jgi:hypothetical protein
VFSWVGGIEMENVVGQVWFYFSIFLLLLFLHLGFLAYGKINETLSCPRRSGLLVGAPPSLFD